MKFLLDKILIVAFLLIGSYAFGQEIPVYGGFVNDYKNLLSRSEKIQLERYLTNFSESTSNEIAIAIMDLPQGASVEDYTIDLARTWGVGQAGNDNGVVVAVYMNERQVDIEVGYGLEPVITDILAYNVITDHIRPAFRESRYFDGLNEAVQILAAAAKEEFSESQRQRYYRQQKGRPVETNTGVTNLVVTILIIVLFLYLTNRGNGGRGRGGGYGGSGWYWGPVFWGGGSGFGGGNSGGGFGGGDFGGGDFGGFGGGDFGGGGAMGDW